MKASGEVFGIVSKWEAGKDSLPTFEPKTVGVLYTEDELGKTLSIGSDEDGFMVSVPYEAVQKIIKKGGQR